MRGSSGSECGGNWKSRTEHARRSGCWLRPGWPQFVDSGPTLDGSIGEIDVFASGKRLPAADGEVGAGSNAEVRAVDVRVPVAKVVTIEPGLFYCEWQSVAWPDGAEDEVDALVGVGDHLGEPVSRDAGVGVGVGKPHRAGIVGVFERVVCA